MEIDIEKEEEDRLKRELEGIMKADTNLVARNNLLEKEEDNIVKDLILKDFSTTCLFFLERI
jgi:hypothetical protein